MSDDSEIRAAFEDIAGLTPDAVQLRSTLDGRIRAYRQRRLILAGAATVAGAAAVGVPAALFFTRDRNPLIAATPEPSPRGGNRRYRLGVRATWLPEGFGEATREVILAPEGQSETHGYTTLDVIGRSPGAGQDVLTDYVVLDVGPVTAMPTASASPPRSGQVDINGRPGTLDYHGGPAQVIWSFADGRRVQLDMGYVGVNDTGAAALRFARGLVEDDSTGVEQALSWGWLPPDVGTDVLRVGLGGNRRSWKQSLETQSLTNPGGAASLNATLSREVPTSAPPTGGEQVTVQGRPARLLSSEVAHYVEVIQALDDGRQLQIIYYPSDETQATRATARATILHIADTMRIGPDPYTGWMS